MSANREGGITLNAEFFEFIATEFARLVSEPLRKTLLPAQSLIVATEARRRFH